MEEVKIKIPWTYNQRGEVNGPWPSKDITESVLIIAALKLRTEGKIFNYWYLTEAFDTLTDDELEILC